jgi:hypothetical protein
VVDRASEDLAGRSGPVHYRMRIRDSRKSQELLGCWTFELRKYRPGSQVRVDRGRPLLSAGSKVAGARSGGSDRNAGAGFPASRRAAVGMYLAALGAHRWTKERNVRSGACDLAAGRDGRRCGRELNSNKPCKKGKDS